jgi:hypothetical protein
LRADVNAAFPKQTTAVPEVSLAWSGPGPRFVFRWYKLTGDWKTRDWIEALLKRDPPPLAIIGGSSSDNARELATHLNQLTREFPEADRPLLLLTQATADRVAPFAEGDVVTTRAAGKEEGSDPSSGVKLTQLYPGRTFRFCFTNRQMATAVSNFIWSRDDLRPDMDPVYMAMWNDDSYSRDLIDGFWGALRQVVAQDLANQWAWALSQPLLGTWPPNLGSGIFPAQRLQVYPERPLSASSFRLDIPAVPHRIDSSVGSFGTPNHYEAKVAGELLDGLLSQSQSRPLLIVAGQSQPSRRFLRGLVRGVPSLSKQVQVVVATGDAISFNTVYRDRQVAWNIQDLPFPLVFFCHRNPIDPEAGFRASAGEEGRADDEQGSTAATGTEDVLLFGDIVEAILQTAAPLDGTVCASAAELAERLAGARLQDDRILLGGDGVLLFSEDGQRQSGTGEHVVCLQPVWDEDFKDRLLPRATIEVWAWRRRDWGRNERGQHWQRCGRPLTMSYSDTRTEGGGAHDGH